MRNMPSAAGCSGWDLSEMNLRPAACISLRTWKGILHGDMGHKFTYLSTPGGLPPLRW